MRAGKRLDPRNCRDEEVEKDLTGLGTTELVKFLVSNALYIVVTQICV